VKLQWKFWTRSKKKSAPSPTEEDLARSWQPPLTAVDVVGLQRIVGNQAVLALLAARDQSAATRRVANKTSSTFFGRKPRKD
jgi:hypothetical protein